MEKLVGREWSEILTVLVKFWNFQLFSIEGSPITLGKIFVGIVLAVLGYFLARKISQQMFKILFQRLSHQPTLQHNLERLSFYVLYIFLLLFVLQMLSIPVTIFTVLGGAFAIGIGFGSQNLVNNFISGLIVMIEQPVRVGDWVEIEGLFGQIENIGSRSTYMRMLDHKQTVIPNSMFLEKAFVNWTLSDTVVGSKVSLGVAYGTDPKLVRNILLKAAEEHPDVLKSPAPSVLFQDFADSSLNFDLFFSMRFSANLTFRRVASDLRFRIEELVKENQITIPFPHRELIFNPKGGLKVSLQKEN